MSNPCLQLQNRIPSHLSNEVGNIHCFCWHYSAIQLHRRRGMSFKRHCMIRSHGSEASCKWLIDRATSCELSNWSNKATPSWLSISCLGTNSGSRFKERFQFLETGADSMRVLWSTPGQMNSSDYNFSNELLRILSGCTSSRNAVLSTLWNIFTTQHSIATQIQRRLLYPLTVLRSPPEIANALPLR